MPFFLATASPSFSALTMCCGLAGATGATNALAPESSNVNANLQRMITAKAGRGLSVSPEDFNSRLLRLERSSVAPLWSESVLASVFTPLASRNF